MSELREIRMRIQTDPTAATREDTFAGKRYLVAPVIMIQEGVLHGANARYAEFCPGSELEKLTVQWNGRPIVLNHPQVQGVYVSANSPTVLEDWSFGFVFNSRYEDKKLKAEAWIDIDRAAELGGDFQSTLDRIQSGEEAVEVSTGLYTDLIEEQGTHDGRKYNGRWANIISDHLAILPNTQGACSVADGCGIPRINEIQAAAANLGLRVNETAMRTYTSDCDGECGGTCGDCGGLMTEEEKRVKAQSLVANALAGNVMMNDAYSILSQALGQKYGDTYDYVYIDGITTDACIFCTFSGGWSKMATMSVKYNMSATGDVTFTSEPEEVILMTQVMPKPKVNAGTSTTPAGGSGSDTVNSPPGAVKMTEDPVDDGDADDLKVPATDSTKKNNEGGTTVAPVVAAAPTQGEPQTMEAYLASMPEEMRTLVRDSLDLQAQRKAELIGAIKANRQNVFTDDQLNSFDVKVLTSMAALAAPVMNAEAPQGQGAPSYSGRGGASLEPLVQQAGAEPKVNADENDFGAPTSPRIFEKDTQVHRPGAWNTRAH